MQKRTLSPTRQDWQNEQEDLIRGACGGFLFGIPLLYTMEVWWIGSYTEPPLMLLIMGVTFVIVLLLNRTDGFRQISPDDPVQAAMDSLEAMALGYLCVTFTLMLLNEVTWETSLDEAMGKIILEGVPFSIGVAIARSILKGSRDQAEPESEDAPAQRQKPSRRENYNATIADVGATLIGTIIIAFNVAPTDEISMLTAASSPPWLLAIMAASLLLSYCIVFVAGLTAQQERLQQQGLIQHPLVETVVCYLLALLAAGLMLWFFHRLSLSDPWTSWLQQTLILGLPATIGGAAGRLAT